MGFVDRWQTVPATYREMSTQGLAGVPQWARIAEVGRKSGPFVTLTPQIQPGAGRSGGV